VKTGGIITAYSYVLQLHVFARNTTEDPSRPRLSVAAVLYSSDTLLHEQVLNIIAVGKRKDIHIPVLAPGL
jgi:hypothetical protein